MLIELKDASYAVEQVKELNYLRIRVTDGQIEIEFQRIERGWASLHETAKDQIFPEEDTWRILSVAEFIYMMKNQLN